MDKKICTKCNQEKTIDQFGNDKHKPDGLTCRCKECINKEKRMKYKNRSNYEVNYDKLYFKNYYIEHKEEYQKRSSKRYLAMKNSVN